MPASTRRANSGDLQAWRTLRRVLWPDISDVENASECEAILGDDDFAVFVADAANVLVGFVEARLRQYADGCDSSPVGFIEGWYVAPESRHAGVGRKLVFAAEEWARSRGCTEMASDALLENIEGHAAHKHLGYSEVEKKIAFRKDLRIGSG